MTLHSNPHGNTEEEIIEYWRSTTTDEPVTEEIRELVKAELKFTWAWARVSNFRDNIKNTWVQPNSSLILLKDSNGTVDQPKLLHQLYNKPTGFYWLYGAQEIGAEGIRGLTPTIILAAIFAEWMRGYEMRPSIEYEHFFANAVRVGPTGPSTVKGIIEAHTSLYKQASDELHSPANKPTKMQHYGLQPLYRAIVVILDRLDKDKWQDPADGSDGKRSVDAVAKSQSVLIARTGMDDGLSLDIAFESLRPLSLPLEREDVPSHDSNVVRVPISVAVRFIIDLEKRESSNFQWHKRLPIDRSLNPYPPRGFDFEVSTNPDAYADAYIKIAEKIGYDNNPDTWASIRQVKARLVGETFQNNEFKPWSGLWKEEPWNHRWE